MLIISSISRKITWTVPINFLEESLIQYIFCLIYDYHSKYHEMIHHHQCRHNASLLNSEHLFAYRLSSTTSLPCSNRIILKKTQTVTSCKREKKSDLHIKLAITRNRTKKGYHQTKIIRSIKKNIFHNSQK